MPNWVFNSLLVSGEQSELDRMVAQLNKPFVKHFPQHNFVDGQVVKTADVQTYDNPVFAFWNICQPTDLVSYYGEEVFKATPMQDNGKVDGEAFMKEFVRSMSEDNDWYHWNVRNWGTKWDVAVSNGDEYPDTVMEITDNGSVMYRFNTAWSPVFEAIEKLSEMFPSLEFDYEYEEEQGWGGSAQWDNGILNASSEYDIPDSHADYTERDRECNCEVNPDYPEYWYQDCPADTSKYEWDGEEWIEKSLTSDSELV
jgi:hypothetical protein